MKQFLIWILILVFTSIGVAQAQTKITGKVLDSEGMPIPFANVSVKGTTQGVATGEDGVYSINAPANAKTLVFSSVSFQTQEQEINGRTVIDVTLNPDATTLDEVMVVAYGTAKKSTFTGAASVVSGKMLEKRQVSNVTQALQGATSGVQAVSVSGQPGAAATVRIRGVGSISASSNPLYVVDGIPFEGNINTLNNTDIESMTVLKDAAANSLYGARGANGVVLITTKRGAKGETKVNINMRAGFNKRGISAYDVVRDPGEYLELAWESLRNRAITNGESNPNQWASNYLINKTSEGNDYGTKGYNPYGNVANDKVVIDGKLNPEARLLYYDDWLKEPFKTGFRTEDVFSVSGGTNNTLYYVSGGYVKDESYIENSDFERYSIRAKVDQTVNKWFKTGANISYARTSMNSPWRQDASSSAANLFLTSQQIAPIYPIWQYDQKTGAPILDNKGNKKYDYDSPFFSNANPISALVNDINDTYGGTANALFYGELTILKDFVFKATISAQDENFNATAFQTPVGGDALNAGGRGTKQAIGGITLTAQQQLNYAKTFDDVHEVDFLAVHESFSTTVRSLEGSKENFLVPNNPELNNAARLLTASSNKQRYSIESYVSRIQYGYDNKYYISASIRRDGSSRFAPESRWGTFWSTGASWRINKEDFLSAEKWIDLLKVKASFGTQGNDALAGYLNVYEDQYVVQPQDGEIAISYRVRGNRKLRWEKSNNFNAGFELGMFTRLKVNFEYYNKTTKDLLYQKMLPTSAGLPNFIWDNAISMRNQGFELEVSYDIVSNNDMLWNVKGNITSQSNKILKLPADRDPDGKGYRVGDYLYKVGNSIHDYYLYKSAGVDPATGKALWYYNENVDGVTVQKATSDYANAEFYETGKSALPKFYGGFTSDFSWKGVDLGVITSFQIGGYGTDNQYSSLMGNMSSIERNVHRDVVDRRWTTPGQITDVPKLEYGVSNQNSHSDRFLVSRSYFSIQNVTLGYTLPKRMSEKISIQKVRVYASIDNLHLWSARKGYDPRLYISGGSTYAYPAMRTFSLGLDLNF